jgi:excisionase family DNA binding protein
MSEPVYLTTRELADLLRIKERKVYDLAASGEVPCSRATGKLLFPRQAIEAWLAGNISGSAAGVLAKRPPVFLGSHDPLLDWALRESGCGIASFFDGSQDGLKRFIAGEGIAAGLHIHETGGSWNEASVSDACQGLNCVLVGWATRERGLIVSSQIEGTIAGLADLTGRRFVPRQAGSGSQTLFEGLARGAGLGAQDFHSAAAVRSETDAALSVREGKGDAAFGLEACARQYGLNFVPVIRERFDLLVDRKAWFDPAMQTFMAFCAGAAFSTRAGELAGYDISCLGQVRYNA